MAGVSWLANEGLTRLADLRITNRVWSLPCPQGVSAMHPTSTVEMESHVSRSDGSVQETDVLASATSPDLVVRYKSGHPELAEVFVLEMDGKFVELVDGTVGRPDSRPGPMGPASAPR